MKLITAALLSSALAAVAQAPAAPAKPNDYPKELQPKVEIISQFYPKIDQKKPTPKAPAETALLFRVPFSGVGTAEVGFKGKDVLYMIFRRGTGGSSWKQNEIHDLYRSFKDANLFGSEYLRYRSGLAAPINAAIIARDDFDTTATLRGN